MNMKTTFGAVGIAMLVVLGMSVIPTGGASSTDDGHHCALAGAGESCESETWTYGGEAPDLDLSGSVLVDGTFTVRVQELSPWTNYWTETTFTVTAIAGVVISCESESDENFGGPATNFAVTTIGTAGEDNLQVGDVLATATEEEPIC